MLELMLPLLLVGLVVLDRILLARLTRRLLNLMNSISARAEGVVQAEMAYKASSKIHPSVGAAVLQGVARLKKEDVEKTQPSSKAVVPDGTTIRTGIVR